MTAVKSDGFLSKNVYLWYILDYMKKLSLTILLMCIALGALAQSFIPLLPLKPGKTVFLYASDKDAALAAIDDPVVADDVVCLSLPVKEECGITEPERMVGDLGQICNINRTARFDLYLPEKPNGKMVVMCPGGGYVVVCTYGEGLYAAAWLLEKGYAVAVHRMPNGHWSVPLEDMQNIFRWCRSQSILWGVDKIGVMGYSAGGHLAASVSTLYVDAATRPDFSVLFYPVITFEGEHVEPGTRMNLLGREEYWAERKGYTPDEYLARQKQYAELKEHYSLEKRVDANTPPAFIVHGQADDVVPVQNSLAYYSSLIANGVKGELQIYDAPKHGFCFFWGDIAKYDWLAPEIRSNLNNSLERWLNNQ